MARATHPVYCCVEALDQPQEPLGMSGRQETVAEGAEPLRADQIGWWRGGVEWDEGKIFLARRKKAIR